MFDPKKVIKEINKSCKSFFPESSFYLNQKSYNRFIISGDNPSKAINTYNREVVNVIKWFADFWFYLDVRFERSETTMPNTFISLSVFQGDISDEAKNQLFRAEWDNFDNDDKHPQPHWHVCYDFLFPKTFDKFDQFIREPGGFLAEIEKQKSKYIELNRIHFAMNGQWTTQGGTHFHRINDENAIKYWFKGLLAHIKSELEYVK
jgi:hypothetical protein